MPKVPTLQPGGGIQTRALPSVQLTTTAPAGAFGGGPAAARATQSSLQLGDITNQLIQREKQRADDIVTTNYHTKLMALKNELKFGENGFSRLKGEDVANSDFVQRYEDLWTQGTQELDKSLKNSEQRAFAARIKGQLGNEHSRGIQNHFGIESSRYEITSAFQNIDGKIEDARQNPTNENVRSMKNLVRAQLTRIESITGDGQDWIDNNFDKKISDFHSGRIRDLLSSKANDIAKDYFKDNKGEMLADARRTAKDLVEKGNIESEGFKRGKNLFDKGITLTNLQDELDKIDNSDVRKETKRQYMERFNLQQNALKQFNEENYTNLYNKAIKAKSMSALSVAELSSLKSSQRSTIEKDVSRVAQGIPLTTNWAFYSNLRDEANANPKKFLNRSEVDIRTKLADPQFKKYLDLRDSLNKGGSGTGADGFLTKRQIFDRSAIRDFKIKKGSLAYDKLSEEVDRREKNLAEDQKVKKISDDDFQGILDRLRTEVTAESTDFDLQIFGFSFLGQLFNVGKEKRRLRDLNIGKDFEVRFEDIPTRERIRLSRILIKEGIQPTERLIESLFSDTVKRLSRVF